MIRYSGVRTLSYCDVYSRFTIKPLCWYTPLTLHLQWTVDGVRLGTGESAVQSAVTAMRNAVAPVPILPQPMGVRSALAQQRSPVIAMETIVAVSNSPQSNDFLYLRTQIANGAMTGSVQSIRTHLNRKTSQSLRALEKELQGSSSPWPDLTDAYLRVNSHSRFWNLFPLL